MEAGRDLSSEGASEMQSDVILYFLKSGYFVEHNNLYVFLVYIF